MKITNAALFAACALAMTVGCDKGEAKPDEPAAKTQSEPVEAKPVEEEVLGADTKASIDAYMKAEIGDDTFVPIYIGLGGVTVDGAPGVRFDPETMRARAADRDGDTLFVEALKPSLDMASQARPLSAEVMKRSPTIGQGLFVEPGAPFGAVEEVLFTTKVLLRATPAEGVEAMSPLAMIGLPQILKLMVRRGDEGWDGYNAVGEPGSGSDERPEQEQSTQPFVVVHAKGIAVSFQGKELPPKKGCPSDGPTLCNVGGVDVTSLIAKANAAEGTGRDAALAELVAAYDLVGLYNTLLEIKAKLGDDTILNVSADENIPMAAISAVLTTTRSLRTSPNAAGTFDDAAAFEAAGSGDLQRPNFNGDALFPDVIIGYD